MFKTIWEKILSLFNKTTQTSDKEFSDNDRYAVQFESTRDVNVTAMFSNQMANYVCNDSILAIEHNNKRAELLDNILQQVWEDSNKIVSRIFGTGGIVLVPYVQDGELFYDKISQNRLAINQKRGNKIVDATILADTHIVNNALTTSIYHRWTDYKIENGNLYITQRYTNDKGTKIKKIDYWKDVQDEIVIPNVDRVPFGYLKSPVDNRITADLYGVPITYGCDKTIRKILHTLDEIEREFDLKEAFVGADITMFNGNNALPTNGLYKKIDSGDDTFWEVFDPAIRDSSYFNKLEKQFAILEKEVGTSKGVLTDPLTTYQNTDEVRRALYNTMSIVGSMRKNIIKGLNDFLYSCDVLANYYNLSPMGEYELKATWGYALIESYQDTLNQYNTGIDKGYIKKAEARNFMMDNETIEESEQAVAEIEAKNPDIKTLLGTNM